MSDELEYGKVRLKRYLRSNLKKNGQASSVGNQAWCSRYADAKRPIKRSTRSSWRSIVIFFFFFFLNERAGK